MLEGVVSCNTHPLKPFPNGKFLTVANSKPLQTTILHSMKMAESSQKR